MDVFQQKNCTMLCMRICEGFFSTTAASFLTRFNFSLVVNKHGSFGPQSNLLGSNATVGFVYLGVGK